MSGYAVPAYPFPNMANSDGPFSDGPVPVCDVLAFAGDGHRQTQSKDRTIMVDLLYIAGGVAILGVFGLYAYALRRI